MSFLCRCFLCCFFVAAAATLLLPLLLLLLLPLLLLLLLLLLGLLLRLQTADLQAYGFSPVCWRMCLVRSPGLAAA